MKKSMKSTTSITLLILLALGAGAMYAIKSNILFLMTIPPNHETFNYIIGPTTQFCTGDFGFSRCPDVHNDLKVFKCIISRCDLCNIVNKTCSSCSIMGEYDPNATIPTVNCLGSSRQFYGLLQIYTEPRQPVCGDGIISSGEQCEPPKKVEPLGSGKFRYCSETSCQWITVDCNDNNPCTNDEFDASLLKCVNVPISQGSVDGCKGDAIEACKYYACVNGRCEKLSYDRVAQKGKCEGLYWCVAGNCERNVEVDCMTDNDCPMQSYSCNSYCDGTRLCSYSKSIVQTNQKCIGNKCQPRSSSEMLSLCGSPQCIFSTSCGAECDEKTPCKSYYIDCKPFCSGVMRCSYASERVLVTPTCQNGRCIVPNTSCGNYTCVPDVSCGACISDVPCGECGIQRCINGVLSICEPIPSKCGVGYVCVKK